MSLTNDLPELTAIYDVFLIVATLILFHIHQHHCKESKFHDSPHNFTIVIAIFHMIASIVMLIMIFEGISQKGQQYYVHPKNYWLFLWCAVSYFIMTIISTKNNLIDAWFKKESIIYLQSKYNADVDVCEKLCQDMAWTLLPIKAIDEWMEKIDEPTVEKVFEILRQEHLQLSELQRKFMDYSNADVHVRNLLLLNKK